MAAAIGIFFGVVTLIGQKYLSVNLNFLSNSASMWAVPAFLVPYCDKGKRKRSALLGMLVLIFCVLGYYVFEAVINHHAYFINKYQTLWLCCAVVGGGVIGLCGNLARTKAGFLAEFAGICFRRCL